jgi:radical SAM protein with 4Fe4S-binding SPASM domain
LSHRPKRRACTFLDGQPFITWDGYLTPCCLRPNPTVFNFGNVLTDGLKAVMQGEKYQSFITSMKEGKFPEICQGCTF